MSDDHRCEECGADMRCYGDEQGTGNYAGGAYGWVCDDCYDGIRNEWEENHGEED